MKTFNEPKPCKVGYWFIQHAKYEMQLIAHASGAINNKHVEISPRIRELRFDKPETCYSGLLHSIATESDGYEQCVVAIVEKSDGTFDTPSINCIQLITPTK